MSAPAADAFLGVPLHGVRLIEASAGTGKTFTLATLVTRLVVERGLRIGQVLAVTYTEAATQELRKRIRERLQLTLDLLDTSPAADEAPAARLTRDLLAAHHARGQETDAQLCARLRQAVLEIDLAAIFTIHGFCARVLREHALESGQGFDAPALLANDTALREAVAADLWRNHGQDSDGIDDLSALWSGGYRDLARDLPALLREPVLLPPDAPLPTEPSIGIAKTGAALMAAFAEHGDDFRSALLAALDGKVLHAGSYKPDWINALFAEAAAWCAAGEPAAVFEHPKLRNLLQDTLLAKTNDKGAGRTPDSPICSMLPDYLDALDARAMYLQRRRARLLHLLRGEAGTRIALLKQQQRLQTYDDMIDGVADALAGERGDALAAALRTQYAVALVDEFQDTDARQWMIFNRVFGSGSDEPALFLIGDPKQAIYGFRGGDVHTYLDAAALAERAPALRQNFRSRPAVLAAIDALYAQAGGSAFIDQRIVFHPVESGGKRADADYQRRGSNAPALTVWQAPQPPLDDKGKRKPWSAGVSRALAAEACVAAIHAVLSDARNDNASIDGKPVQPGDIAVLVRSHHEATLIQRGLALAGIPAVAAGKQSLYATDEARDLHALLLALLHSGDDGRLRAALATVLVGLSARQIAALDTDADAHRDWQLKAQAWRDRLLRGGPLALVNALAAEHAPRLLALLDGERRLSNTLQLAELLQEAQDSALGLQGLVDWLGDRIAGADPNDEAQLLRLESDARRVQIVTLHKSKGLEYPLVFLPFVGIGHKASSPGRQCVMHHEQHGRRLHWNLALPDAEWSAASEGWKQEQRAEDARLLYVGLTRAEHALWIASGEFFASKETPLAAMLQASQALEEAGVMLDARVPAATLPRLPALQHADIPPARSITRPISNDWWVYSFSQLAKADAGDANAASTLPTSGGNDEPDAGTHASASDVVDADSIALIALEEDRRFGGNRYGVALHAALETIALAPVDFAAWADWQPGDAAPADHASHIADALRTEGYTDDELADGITLSTRLIGHTLTVAMPEATRLCDVPADERRPEIEFQFALQPTRVDALLALLHRYGVVRERDRFGIRQRLEGLMTGLIDLTYRHDGKWYVLDYKSNRLPGYGAEQMAAAMAHSEYDLQALIYTLALHRWLRFRLGDGYDYARDFGGIRYLFCRGLDATRADSPGIHAQRFAPELVHALNALFGHTEQGAAA